MRCPDRRGAGDKVLPMGSGCCGGPRVRACTRDLVRPGREACAHIADPAKGMIVAVGDSVDSTEVEDALTTHPAVAEATVVCRSERRGGGCQ